MARSAYLLFGVVAYLIFFATFLYLIAFVGDLPWVPRTVDKGAASALLPALIVDLSLIGLFGLQHSVMAGKASNALGRGSCRNRSSAASMFFLPALR